MARFLRLFRVLKLARYSRAIHCFHRALIIAREELILFGAAALVLLYVAAVGIGLLASALSQARELESKEEANAQDAAARRP